MGLWGNSEGGGKRKLAKPCASYDAVFAGHELAICGAYVAWLSQVSNPEVEMSDNSLGIEVVTRSRANKHWALGTLEVEFDVHHGRCSQEKFLDGWDICQRQEWFRYHVLDRSEGY